MLTHAKIPTNEYNNFVNSDTKFIKINIKILDNSIYYELSNIQQELIPDKEGKVVNTKETYNTFYMNTLFLEDFQKELQFTDGIHIAVGTNNSAKIINSAKSSSISGFIKTALSSVSNCIFYMFFPSTECTFNDALISVITDELTVVESNTDIIVSDLYNKIDFYNMRRNMYPNIIVSSDGIVRDNILTVTLVAENTKTSIDSLFTVNIRGISGIPIKSQVVISNNQQVDIPIMVSGLNSGDYAVIEIGFENVIYNPKPIKKKILIN